MDLYLRRDYWTPRNPSPGGTWTLTLTNNTANSLTCDGWLAYIGKGFNAIDLIGGDNNYLVASPGNATSAITTGSYVSRHTWFSTATGTPRSHRSRQDSVSDFSSVGPRRDEVLKPDISAPGQHLISCFSHHTSSNEVDPNYIVEDGSYIVKDGTSMASPVVTGAVALLLQANPFATALEIKNHITSSASSDYLTQLPRSVPNPTWGYGRLDAFKAMSSLLNCSCERKTYRYDASTRTVSSGEESESTFSTNRVAVRFTPDINGFLGGFFFQTGVTTTDLIVEIRTNVAGIPGNLLGSLNIPANRISKYSWNYLDLSYLNISVSYATDYFVILLKNANTGANWSLFKENIALDNRSLISPDGGSWTNPGFDYKIRSVVYSECKNVRYTFTGTGNWSTASNWSNNTIPPNPLPAGAEIVIDYPPGGECIHIGELNIPSGSKLTIKQGKSLRIIN